MSQRNVHVVRSLYDAFNRGDLDALDRGFSRDIVWNQAENSLYAGGNPYRGFAAIYDGVFAPSIRDFDGFRCDLEHLFDAGETVVGTGRYHGKCRGTGKLLSAQCCHVIHLARDGKIDRVQGYSDTLAEAEAIGQAQRLEEVRILHPAM